jgi:hypothetical protein
VNFRTCPVVPAPSPQPKLRWTSAGRPGPDRPGVHHRSGGRRTGHQGGRGILPVAQLTHCWGTRHAPAVGPYAPNSRFPPYQPHPSALRPRSQDVRSRTPVARSPLTGPNRMLGDRGGTRNRRSYRTCAPAVSVNAATERPPAQPPDTFVFDLSVYPWVRQHHGSDGCEVVGHLDDVVEVFDLRQQPGHR